MRLLFVCLFFLISSSYASDILKCLGSEEDYYHKNNFSGVFYKLNQQMISEFVQFNHKMTLTPDLQSKACSSQFTSLVLLQEAISGRKIFINSESFFNKSEKSLINQQISLFPDIAARIFIDFLSNVQKYAKTSDCLRKNCPEINEAFTKLQYLGAEQSPSSVVQQIGNSENIIKKVISLTSKKNSCFSR